MRVWRDVSGPAGSASTTSRSCGSNRMSSIRSAWALHAGCMIATGLLHDCYRMAATITTPDDC
eukprot:5982893-Prymnesium_polylepis.1